MSELISEFDLVGVARAGYGLAALAHALFAIYLLLAWRGGRAGAGLLVAVLCGGAWSVTTYFALTYGGAVPGAIAGISDAIRIGAWYALMLILMASGGMVRTPIVRLAVVAVLLLVVRAIGAAVAGQTGQANDPAGKVLMMSSLLAAIYGLVLIEQLYRSLPEDGRWGFKPILLGVAAAFAFDLYLYAEGLLFQSLDPAVWSVRGFVHASILPLVAVSVARNPHWKIRISVSRQVVFHTSALLMSGLYLLLVAGAGYYVRFFGGEWGRAFQVALVFAGVVVLIAVGLSGSLRARLRVWLSKHLFAYRYDYRSEWLGFTRALSAGDERSPGEAVISALADLVESPGGGLWLRDSNGDFRMHARLNMPASDDVEPAQGPLAHFLGDSGWIVDLAEYRAERARYSALSLPEWISRIGEAWLIVPLTAGGTLVGFAVLLSPRTPFEVDWEVLDLLKTAQHQAATYLSQLKAQEALLEAKKFDAFNRMSAFVVHDLKNLVSQLSLLMRNAERHAGKPEFQQDMLETVAHVESRMRALMAQLLEKTPIDPKRPVDLAAMMARIATAKARQKPAPQLVEGESVMVMAHSDRLERILGHIVQNAMDATDEGGKVGIRVVRCGAAQALVSVRDTGCGMSPEFVRDRLFKPFQTTKESGMGIGAYETRQYVREIGGSIEVDSEPGVGTEVRVLLPACAGEAVVAEQ